MIIYDEQGNVIENYDLTFGHIETHTQTVEHEAVEAVVEVSHYETIKEYPNGGRDVKKIVDVPAVPRREAWTESIEYGIYIPYTAEELERMNQPSMEERLESVEAALNILLTGVSE